MSKRGREYLKVICLTVLAWVIVVIVVFPLLWMVSSSLKAETEMITIHPSLLPSRVDWSNFQRLFAGDFWLWFRNSVIVALGTVGVVITLGTLGAYSLTRFSYPGRGLLAGMVLMTYLFPSVLMLVPLFLIISQLGLNNTYLALILADTTFALPFSIWLLRSYFISVPVQVEEAALIDGASRISAFIEVVLPQVAPGIISTAIFTFILSWDDYLFANVFTSSNEMKTLPVGIARFAQELNADWGLLMAGSTAVTIPVLIFFGILQRGLLPNLSAGAVKV
ncbi:MAG: carbohydrate ABC transporter permease [Hyphomicrobiales bacterium]|nr:carbohydrate ABC transporter permease [Hyphomicrobiales bacterium]